MDSRSIAIFYRIASFENALKEFDIAVDAQIEAHITHFERAWKASKHDGDLPSSFCFEAYHRVEHAYRLCQIRVGPNHGYRCVVMFLDRSSAAYWVHVFKKTRNKQPKDMARAYEIAERLWNHLKEN